MWQQVHVNTFLKTQITKIPSLAKKKRKHSDMWPWVKKTNYCRELTLLDFPFFLFGPFISLVFGILIKYFAIWGQTTEASSYSSSYYSTFFFILLQFEIEKKINKCQARLSFLLLRSNFDRQVWLITATFEGHRVHRYIRAGALCTLFTAASSTYWQTVTTRTLKRNKRLHHSFA